MRRIFVTLGVLILAVLLIAGGATFLDARGRVATAGPVYSVAQVYRGASNQPAAWDGRAVLVSGYIDPHLQAFVGGVRGGAQFLLTDSSRAVFGRVPTLLVAIEPGQARWLRWIRQLPGIGSLLPAPQREVIGARATYRVRLAAATGPNPCTQQEPCISASLLDGEA